MSELLAFGPIEVEESAPTHWVGACGDLVIAFTYEGSQDDLRHVTAIARQIERSSLRQGGPVKLLLATPSLPARPPAANVRIAFTQAARRLGPLCSRASLVVRGEGFSAALHRSAITGVLALARTSVPVKIHADFGDALAYLLGTQRPALAELGAWCEARARPGPDRR